MKWYFCLNQDALPQFSECVIAAVHSCIQNTTLQPHFLFDGARSEFTDYLESLGVTIHFHRVSFADELDASAAQGGYVPFVARGAYLRFDIPLIEQQDQYVLYTDVDVLFLADPVFECWPEVLAAAEEYERLESVCVPYGKVFNSGVMLINVAGFAAERERLLSVARDSQFYFHGDGGYYDQGALNRHFAGNFDKLDQSLNWRPFAKPPQAPVIVHFHGTKPWEVGHYARGLEVQRDVSRTILSYAPDVYLAVFGIFWRYLDPVGLDIARRTCPSLVESTKANVFLDPGLLSSQERLGDLHGFYFQGEWIYPQHFYGHEYIQQLLVVLRRLCAGREEIRMLEWGTGFSTIAAQYVFDRMLSRYSVDTLDNFAPYQAAVKAVLRSGGKARIRFHLADVTGPGRSQRDPELAYSTLPLSFAEQYDVIFIDGRRRMECALVAALLAKPDATIILHDFRRGRYQAVLALFDVIEDYGQFRLMRLRRDMQSVAQSGLPRVRSAIESAQ